MARELSSVELNFNFSFDLEDEEIRALRWVVARICDRHERNTPGEIAWHFGEGSKMLVHPMAIEDHKPIPFDDSIYELEGHSREAFEGERNYKKP